MGFTELTNTMQEWARFLTLVIGLLIAIGAVASMPHVCFAQPVAQSQLGDDWSHWKISDADRERLLEIFVGYINTKELKEDLIEVAELKIDQLAMTYKLDQNQIAKLKLTSGTDISQFVASVEKAFVDTVRRTPQMAGVIAKANLQSKDDSPAKLDWNAREIEDLRRGGNPFRMRIAFDFFADDSLLMKVFRSSLNDQQKKLFNELQLKEKEKVIAGLLALFKRMGGADNQLAKVAGLMREYPVPSEREYGPIGFVTRELQGCMALAAIPPKRLAEVLTPSQLTVIEQIKENIESQREKVGMR